MKFSFFSGALAAILLLVCVNAQAQTATATPGTAVAAPAASTKKSDLTPYMGTITAVDATADTVTLSAAKGPMTLKVTPTTKFKGGKSLTDFAVGDKVTGSFMTDASGTMEAHSMHKKKAKKP